MQYLLCCLFSILLHITSLIVANLKMKCDTLTSSPAWIPADSFPYCRNVVCLIEIDVFSLLIGLIWCQAISRWKTCCLQSSCPSPFGAVGGHYLYAMFGWVQLDFVVSTIYPQATAGTILSYLERFRLLKV
jgi:hypothetical protein